jgi:TonB family protein
MRDDAQHSSTADTTTGGWEEQMSQTAVLRATSLATSGVLLAAIVIAGLTMSISLRASLEPADHSIITTIVRPPPDEPPVRPTRQPTLPPPTAAEEPMETELAPLEPQDVVEIDTGPVVADPLVSITRPHWERRPRDLQAYYPRRALQRNVEGDVLLNCVVRVTGTLDCAVISETPAGWDFGSAARRIAADHRMTPATRDGVAVEGRYIMRVPFRLD